MEINTDKTHYCVVLSFKYMLLWFLPFALIWVFTMYASCFGYLQCFGAILLLLSVTYALL